MIFDKIYDYHMFCIVVKNQKTRKGNINIYRVNSVDVIRHVIIKNF